MDFREQLRAKLEESFGVHFEPIAKETKPEIDEGDVKLGGEEMALANKEMFIKAIQQVPEEEFGLWLTKAMTNEALNDLANRLQQVEPDAAPDNGQPPANDVGDLSGLTDEPAEPEAAPVEEPAAEEPVGDEGGDEFDLNL